MNSTPTPFFRFTERNKRIIYRIISGMMIFYCIVRLFSVLRTTLQGGVTKSYGFTEFMINFEGGFVRRGLLGQGLYKLVELTGCDPIAIIMAFCLVVYLGVGFFLWKKFRERGLCWWLLLSPFMIGYSLEIIRKDFLCYAIIIGEFYLLRKSDGDALRLIGATVLMIFGLFVHEAFLFYGVPIAVLLVISSESANWGGWIKGACLLSVLITFAVLCHYHGDKETALAIYRSWDELTGLFNGEYLSLNSIGAIGWNTDNTLSAHYRLNFWSEADGLNGFVVRPLYGLLIYYFLANFFYVMRRDDTTFTGQDRTAFSSLLLITFISLSPMFICLSCDYARLYQYSAITAVSAFLILPEQRLAKVFNIYPRFFIRFVERFNATLNRLLPPSKGLIILLLLNLSSSPSWFNIASTIRNSVLYADCNFFITRIEAFIK